MKIRLSIFLFLCCVLIGFSQKVSSINFVIKNLGINVDGHFNTFTVDAEFNSNGELLNLSGEIVTSSITTGIDSRDDHLLEEDYFNVKKHKQITLKSEKINKKSANSYSVKANLTIKGIVKTITVPVNILKDNGTYKIMSSFEINRKDFDIGGGSFVMSKTVKINVIHFQ